MAIVRPRAVSVEEYKAAGHNVKPEVPPDCPTCGEAMIFWSGYERDVRIAFDPDAPSCQRYARIWIPRVHCERCEITPGLLPAFCLSRRLDEVGVIGATLAAVAAGGPVAAAAAMQAVPRSTAKGWTSRFAEAAHAIAARFASVAISLGSGPFDLSAQPLTAAVEAIGRAFDAAMKRLAGNVVGVWRFVVVVSGGALLATNRSPP